MSSALVSAYTQILAPIWGHLSKKRVEAVTVEPVGGWWMNNNSWGYQFTGLFPQALTDVVPILNNDQIPGPPRAVMLSLFRGDRVGSKSETSTRNAEIYAQIVYGAGGINNTILVDWHQGGQFALPCTAVRINAVPYVPDLTEDAGAYRPTDNNGKASKLQIGAVLGLQGAGPALPPTFTTPYITIPAPGNYSVQVPEFAERCIPMIGKAVAGADPIPGNFTVSTTCGVFARNTQFFTCDNAILQNGFELIGRPATVTIQNNDAGLDRRVGFIFLLRL